MTRRMCDFFASIVIAGILYSGCLTPVEAQNVTCATRPAGDSSNACASTAFVQGAVGGGFVIPSLTADASTAYSATNASANAANLNTALATGRCAYVPYNANGYSFLGNTVVLGTSQCLIVEGDTLMKSQPSGSGWFVHITSLATTQAPASITGGKWDMTGAGATTTVFRHATTSAVVSGVRLNNYSCQNSVECIGMETSASNYVVDFQSNYGRMFLTLGRQIYLSRTRGFITFFATDIDNTLNTPPVTWKGAQFDDVIGLTIRQFYVTGPSGTGTFQSGQIGLDINGTGAGVASVWLDDVLIDSTSGNGIQISSINFVQGNFLRAYANLGYAFNFTSVAYSNLTNLGARGANDVTGASAAKDGFLCTNCSYVTVNGLVSTNNTGNGAKVAGTSTAVAISGLDTQSNTGFGYVISDSAANSGMVSGSFATNTAGTISNTSSGTGNYFCNIAGTTSCTFSNSSLIVPGSSSGSQTWKPAAVASGTITLPAGTVDFSATGGASQVVKQTSSGGIFTVAQLANTDITGLGTASTANTGTSGHTVPFLDGNNTYSGTSLFTAALPTFGSNGQAGIGTTATLGGELGGQGSTNDVTLVNKSGTAVLNIPTGTQTINMTTGGTSPILFSQTSNYGIVSLNNVGTLAGGLGFAGGASGDTGALYFVAPSSVHFFLSGTDEVSFSTTFFQPSIDNTLSLGASVKTWKGIWATLSSDAASTDNSVCVLSTGEFRKGSGAAGICLGTSSQRYKKNIVPMSGGIDEIMALQPKNFRYLPGFGDDGAREQYGFIAEDVVKVLPKLVGLDTESRPNSVDLVAMIPIIVRSIQQLKTDNDILRTQLTQRSKRRAKQDSKASANHGSRSAQSQVRQEGWHKAERGERVQPR